MLTENEKNGNIKKGQPEVSVKDYLIEWNKKNPNYKCKWNEKHPNYRKDYQIEWKKKHPDYMRDYLKNWKLRNREKMRGYRRVWNEKHPNYYREWVTKNPNYMKDYLKEWRRNVKGINVGFNLKIQDASLAAGSDLNNSVYREIEDVLRKDFGSKNDEL